MCIASLVGQRAGDVAMGLAGFARRCFVSRPCVPVAQTIAVRERLKIRFETVVTSGSQVQKGNGTATVEAESGEKFTASRAVVTLPLGTLKAGDVTFSPPLSPNKSLAIERLGMGTCNKVLTAFEDENFAGAPWAAGCVGGTARKSFARQHDCSTGSACEQLCESLCVRKQMGYFAVEAQRDAQP